MSERSASSPPASILRNKRLRFDSTNVSSDTASPARKLTPTAAAKAAIDAAVVTLPKEIQPTVKRLAYKHLSAYSKWYLKNKNLSTVMNDDDFLPKCLGFKVSLDAIGEISESEDFKALSITMDAAVTQAKKQLRPHVFACWKLNIAHLRDDYCKVVIEALPLVAELLLAIVDEERYGPHKLVADYLALHGDDVVSHLGFSLTEFIAAYQKVHDLASSPVLDTAIAAASSNRFQGNATAAAAAVTPATLAQNGPLHVNDRRGDDELDDSQMEIDFQLLARQEQRQEEESLASISTLGVFTQAGTAGTTEGGVTTPTRQATFTAIINGHSTILNHLRTMIGAFSRGNEAYHHQIKSNEKAERLKRIQIRQANELQSNEVAESLERESTLDAATINSLMDQKFEAKSKPLRQEVSSVKSDNAKLKKELDKLKKENANLKKSKNNASGAQGEGGAASTKESTSNRPTPQSSSQSRRSRGRGADAKDRDSQQNASARGRKKSKSKSPTNRSNSKQRQRKQKSKSKKK